MMPHHWRPLAHDVIRSHDVDPYARATTANLGPGNILTQTQFVSNSEIGLYATATSATRDTQPYFLEGSDVTQYASHTLVAQDTNSHTTQPVTVRSYDVGPHTRAPSFAQSASNLITKPDDVKSYVAAATHGLL